MKLAKTFELMGGKLAALSVVVCGLALSVGAENVIYQNDFTTRESAQPIPTYGVVHQAQPYALEKTMLCFLPEATTGFRGNGADAVARMALRESYTYSNVTGINRPNYDGWFTPYFIKPSNTQFKIFPTVVKDNGNPCFTWYHPN